MKIAIITDSNSGITQSLAKELGISVVPMPVLIDGEQYYEDLTLSQEEFYEKLKGDANVSTSQPNPLDVGEIWAEALKTNDAVIYIPMSSGLSGSCQTAQLLAQDYGDRVFVADNRRISVTQQRSVEDALHLAQKGDMSAGQIRDFLEQDGGNSSIYIMLDTLTYLKRGGRITPAAAALGNILRLKPVLQIQGEKLDAFAKARTKAQGKTTMVNAIKNDIAHRFGGSVEDVRLFIAHSHDSAGAEAFREEVKTEFPGCEIVLRSLSLSIGCHLGPGALALACAQKHVP